MLPWLRRWYYGAPSKPAGAYGPCVIFGCRGWATTVVRNPAGAERSVCSRCAEELIASYGWLPVISR